MFPDFSLPVSDEVEFGSGIPTSSTSVLQDSLSFISTVIFNYKKILMTQLYKRNSAHHGLLARQGFGNGNDNGNHSGNDGLGPPPASSNSRDAGMFTAWLISS